MKSFTEREGIYRQSLSTWGFNSTLLLVIRESAELISVVIRLLKKPDDRELLIRKMATVENLFAHIKTYYDCWKTVEERKDIYLDEVRKRAMSTSGKGEKRAG
jgi:hypothetical protein